MFLFWCVLCVSALHGVLSEAQLVQSSSEVKKPGESVKFPCKTSGFTFTSYYMHWIQQVPGKGLTWIGRIDPENGKTVYSSSFEGRITMTTDNSITTAYLQIDRLSVKDSATYYCVSGYSNRFDLWGPGVFVTVTSASISGPSVFPLVPCCDSLQSDTVSIGCLSTGYIPTPVDVTWNSGSITSGIRTFPAVLGRQGTYLSASLLTIPASEWTSDKKYVCNVNHTPSGTKVNKEVEACQVKASEPKVSVMQASCGESGSVDLVCLISEYTPKDINVQWLLNGEPTSIIPKNTPAYRENDGTYGSRSKVSVPKNDWNAGDRYTCKVNHPASKTKTESSIQKCPAPGNMIPKVVILPPSPKDILITKQPKLTCQVSQVESPDSLTIKWTREDGKKPLVFTSEPERDQTGAFIVRSVLKLSLSDWKTGKEFTCTVQTEDLPTPIEKKIHFSEVEITDPIVNLCPPPPEELPNLDFVDLVCVIKRFNPKDIYVQWKRNGVVLDEEYYTNTAPVQQDDGTYFMFSILTIDKSDWIRGATFTCDAVHDKITSKEIKRSKGK